MSRTKTGVGLWMFLLACASIGTSREPVRVDPSQRLSYERARPVFYQAIRDGANALNLPDIDKLARPETKLPGLYEHLMNFYVFARWGSRERDPSSRDWLDLSRQMAEEFLDSLRSASRTGNTDPLETVLTSTGYFTRKMHPIFRRFIRPLAARLRGQWAWKALNLDLALAKTRGGDVRVALIDTGIDPTLKEIRPRMTRWKNFLDGSNPLEEKGLFPYDWEGHGTALAGLIIQVAPEADLLIVKFYDKETMLKAPPTRWTTYLIAAGLYWAAQNGADIICLTSALDFDFPAIREATKYCWEKNVMVITSMKNLSRPEGRSVHFPAAYPWTLAVGGVESAGGRLRTWELSAKGGFVDVVAPAISIRVDRPSYLDTLRRPSRAAGNSLAAAIVSGGAALILSAMDPDCRNQQKEIPGLLVDGVRDTIRATASNELLGLAGHNPVSGYGLIDIAGAIDKIRTLNPSKLPSGFSTRNKIDR